MVSVRWKIAIIFAPVSSDMQHRNELSRNIFTRARESAIDHRLINAIHKSEWKWGKSLSHWKWKQNFPAVNFSRAKKIVERGKFENAHWKINFSLAFYFFYCHFLNFFFFFFTEFHLQRWCCDESISVESSK